MFRPASSFPNHKERGRALHRRDFREENKRNSRPARKQKITKAGCSLNRDKCIRNLGTYISPTRVLRMAEAVTWVRNNTTLKRSSIDCLMTTAATKYMFKVAQDTPGTFPPLLALSLDLEPRNAPLLNNNGLNPNHTHNQESWNKTPMNRAYCSLSSFDIHTTGQFFKTLVRNRGFADNPNPATGNSYCVRRQVQVFRIVW